MRKSGKMASHNELGKEGENAAVKYLLEKGYEIRHRNWHSGHRDLDIVAQKEMLWLNLNEKREKN